jgi:hypothetical protein
MCGGFVPELIPGLAASGFSHGHNWLVASFDHLNLGRRWRNY